MQITLNGEARTFNQGLRLAQLIQQLQLEGKRLAVEINREIIPRSQYEQTEIHAGDRIEILHAIGGG